MRKASKPRRWMKVAGSVLAAVAVGALLAVYGFLRLSLPKLEGEVAAPGLSAPVIVARDARGAPVLTGKTRADLAWGLGYLHAQERFFQMDLQRRAAAGELSDLVGPAALKRDRAVRLHRFRHRAEAVLALATADERRAMDAYVAGVNRGLNDLAAPPFEYALLSKKPAPWAIEDSVLVVYAMYLALQEPDGASERRHGEAIERLGRPLADFLFPDGTSWDAPLDGSTIEAQPIPSAGVEHGAAPAPAHEGLAERASPGSNGFAVGGALTAHGAAMVASDMHLSLAAPNIWYRARLVQKDGEHTALDLTGVTLPGGPVVVAGSNGQIAWAFTNSYADTSDVVVLEPAEGDAYLTPQGPRKFERVEERLCAACPQSESLTVEETLWGPVIGTDAKGRKLALRWTAHDPIAINLRGGLELERAASARAALEIAHRLGIPHQNLVVGDTEGHLGWTVTSPLPRRFGHDGKTPTSWAKGDKGWDGYWPPGETPTIYDPPDGRIWTANARPVGGEALQKLGFGDYALGARAKQIRDDLFARRHFDAKDLLAVQLDDRGLALQRWQEFLLKVLRDRAARPEFARLIPAVENWGLRAAPESVGYRLVHDFRQELISLVYDRYLPSAPVEPSPSQGRRPLPTHQADEPVWRLLNERPPQLVPPGFKDWDAVVDVALGRLMVVMEATTHGRLEAFTWGAFNHAGIHHPLTRALPQLAAFLDPPDAPQPGDLWQPRVAAPGFGASERFAVAPGHEAEGLFHMPTGQSGHPLSPYYNLGHEDWAQGRPAPFLPGEAKWVLRFRPE